MNKFLFIIIYKILINIKTKYNKIILQINTFDAGVLELEANWIIISKMKTFVGANGRSPLHMVLQFPGDYIITRNLRYKKMVFEFSDKRINFAYFLLCF
jgi:hypothetical protein